MPDYRGSNNDWDAMKPLAFFRFVTRDAVVGWWIVRICALVVMVGTTSGTAQVTAFDSSLIGLYDSNGAAVRSEQYSGKFRLVTFGFTSCADVCPMTLMAMRQALDRLGRGAGDVVPIFISIDHERDTPRRLGDYVKAFDRRLVGLTGPPDALLRVARGHQVFFEKRYIKASANAYVYDHSAQILVITPDGRLGGLVSTMGTPSEVAERIVNSLHAAGLIKSRP